MRNELETEKKDTYDETNFFRTLVKRLLVFLCFANTLSVSFIFQWSVEGSVAIYTVKTSVTTSSVLIQFRFFYNITAC